MVDLGFCAADRHRRHRRTGPSVSKERIVELANKNEPFLFTIATIDTHEPTTFLDPKCDKKYGDNRDVILCADKMASDFIKWVQKQDFYKNTTIPPIFSLREMVAK